MKYSQHIGIFAAFLLILSCFIPWIETPIDHKILNGINGYISESITFGKQYIAHTFFSGIAILLFLSSKVISKRINIFICFLNLSWAIKNFILFSFCRPECPIVKPGLYLIVFFAITMQIMSFLPTLKKNNN